MSESQKATHQYQTEVNKLLHLVTHALYSNKEVFLRELISNSSDAAEKYRFESIEDASMEKDDNPLQIWIDLDKKARTLTIRDNGIGLSKEEAMTHLGTIAKSGTEEFLAAMTGDTAKDSALIGQFGVGFYSAFVVARKVVVNSRRANLKSDQAVSWASNGEGEYTVETINKTDRGTEIILYLKEGEDEFLDEWRIKQLVTKYSDHIVLPIVMKKRIEEPQSEDQKEGEEPKEPVVRYEDEVVNRATALWTQPRDKISDDEYKGLYKHISHDPQDPLAWSHNKVEGKFEYTTLLYIPEKAGFDLWNRDVVRGLKLYVKRVFVMDEAEQLLPMYLRFVKGVVDSNDLPLNVSREILQNNQVIASMKSSCIKRILSMLASMANNKPEDYAKFWTEFGQVLKEGIAEDYANRDKIAELLRFSSTQETDQSVSLKDYVTRMQEGQETIYYVIADSYLAAQGSPHLEIFKKKGIEVLLLHDRIDEWLVAHLTEFDGKKLQSIAKGDVTLEEETEESKQEKAAQQESYATFIEQMSKVLEAEVKEIRLSDRLTESPACLVADDNDMSGHLQRIMKEMGQDIPEAKPVMEINASHPLIIKLKNEQSEEAFAAWARLVFEQALLAEGAKLKDPSAFVKRVNDLVTSLL